MACAGLSRNRIAKLFKFLKISVTKEVKPEATSAPFEYPLLEKSLVLSFMSFTRYVVLFRLGKVCMDTGIET